MKNTLLIFGIALLFSCNSNQSDKMNISKEEMLNIVKECDDQFRIGVQNRDSALITNMYTDSALYIIPEREILVGKTEIGKDWAGFLRYSYDLRKSILIIFPVHFVI